MAKGNALLGTLRGSAGDVTFRVSNGRQVMSRKATSVKNPRTSKQTYQRMFFATIGKARSAMKKIVDHSFENVTKGMNSLSYFQSRNVELMRGNVKLVPELGIYTAVASYITPKWPYMVANTYRISEGSLPIIRQLPAMLNALPPQQGYEIVTDIDKIRKMVPCFYVSDADAIRSDLIYSYINQGIKAAGGRPGDFFTYCFVSRIWTDPTTGETPVPEKFHFIRLIVSEIKIQSFDGEQSETFTGLFVSNIDGNQYYVPSYLSITLPEDVVWENAVSNFKKACVDAVVVTDGNSTFPFLYANNLYQYDFNAERFYTTAQKIENILSVNEGIVAGTWIHSRPAADDKLLVSTQDMILTDPTGDVYDFNLGIRDAYDAWRNIGSSIGDNTYILEGGTK